MKEENDSKKRLPWPDFLKGLAMVCVVFCHIGGNLPGVNLLLPTVFCIAIFFAVSGHLYNETKGVGFCKLCLRVYIPLFVFSFVPLACLKHILIGDVDTAKSIIVPFSQTLIGWFMGTFVLSSLVFRLFVKHIPIREQRLFISTLLALVGLSIIDKHWLSIINFSTLLVTQWIMMIGYEWKRYEGKEHYGVLMSVFFFLPFLLMGLYMHPQLCVNIGCSVYSNVPLGIGFILALLLLSYNIALKLPYKTFVSKLLILCGRYSIVIFVMHGAVIKNLGFCIPFDSKSWLVVSIYTLLSLCICCITANITEKYAPVLLGIFNEKARQGTSVDE